MTPLTWPRGTKVTALLTDNTLVAQATRNVEEYLDRATEEEHDLGTHWYPLYGEQLAALAEQHGYTRQQGIAIFAIASMSANLAQNLASYQNVLREGPLTRLPGTFLSAKQRAAIAMALASSTPIAHVVGPKIGPFAHALAGDHNQVVIDRWALRIALGRTTKHGSAIPTSNQRAFCQHVYTLVAQRRGITSAAAQAISWVVAVRADGGVVSLPL